MPCIEFYVEINGLVDVESILHKEGIVFHRDPYYAEDRFRIYIQETDDLTVHRLIE